MVNNIDQVISVSRGETQYRPFQEATDIVRSALCALTYRSSGELEPVHVLRIKACCERLGLWGEFKATLSTLHRLRESEDLGAGYWAPTPQRVIKFPGCQLIVAPNPTLEIRRWLSNTIEIAGFGRTISADVAINLPEQAADDWVGSPADIVAWTREKISYAKKNLRPTIHPEGKIEVYAPWHSSRYEGRTEWKRWHSLHELLIGDDSEFLLCRTSGITGRHWFFATTKADRIVAEFEIVRDRLRLLFGLDALNGTSPSVDVLSDGSRQKIVLRMPIPEEEQRVLLAFAQQNEDSEGMSYEFSPHYRPAIEAGLERLGISLR